MPRYSCWFPCAVAFVVPAESEVEARERAQRRLATLATTTLDTPDGPLALVPSASRTELSVCLAED